MVESTYNASQPTRLTLLPYSLIVGAGLAFAAAFFFFKRRNSKTRDGAVGYNNNYTDSSPELVMMQKSAGRNSPYVQVSQTPIPAPVPGPAPAAAQRSPKDVIASILPAAAHDNEIQGRVSALFGQIHRHIDTYYRDVHASITPSMESELVRFGAKDVNMADLLQDCSTPTTALKHALAAYVLGITGPKTANEGETLFPEELKSTSHNITSTSGTSLHHHSHANPTLTTKQTPTSQPQPLSTAASPSTSTPPPSPPPLLPPAPPATAPGPSNPTSAKQPSTSASHSSPGRIRGPMTRKRKMISRG